MTIKKITYTKSFMPLTDGKKVYVRTRDIADALGIKQPFEFNAYLKKYGKVLKGDATEGFRKKNIDDSRTTFMQLKEIIKILNAKSKHFIRIAPNYSKTLQVLEKFA